VADAGFSPAAPSAPTPQAGNRVSESFRVSFVYLRPTDRVNVGEIGASTWLSYKTKLVYLGI
jgi:hypothetical protein